MITEHDILQEYSEAKISRIEVGRRLGEPIGFGDLLMKLHEHQLPLPRFPRDPASPAVDLVYRLCEQAKRERR